MANHWFWIMYLIIGIINFFLQCVMLDPDDAREIAHLPLRQRLAEGFMISGGTDSPFELFLQIISSIAFWPFWVVIDICLGGAWLTMCWTKQPADPKQDPEHSKTT